MKKILLGFALSALAASCRATADVSDSSEACGPDCEMACCVAESECSGATECSDEAKACEGEAKACEGEAKVCPVTGKTIN